MEFDILGIFNVTINNFALVITLLFLLGGKIINAACRSGQEEQRQEVEVLRWMMKKN